MEIGSTKDLKTKVLELKAKSKEPHSPRVLDNWIAKAEQDIESGHGRLGWLVSSTIVTSILQQAVDKNHSPLFLLKGGTLLQMVLPDFSRATTDVDGLIKCDVKQFLKILDKTLEENWGPCKVRRENLEVINVPSKIDKPHRFDLVITIKDKTWRRVQVEISPEVPNSPDALAFVEAPSLAGFGIETPEKLACLSLSYQIAQKFHAVTNPHNPPAYKNDRARDIVDLKLLKTLTEETGQPTDADIHDALHDTFTSRAEEAILTGAEPRHLPITATAYPHWEVSYQAAAQSANLDMEMKVAVEHINDWLNTLQ